MKLSIALVLAAPLLLSVAHGQQAAALQWEVGMLAPDFSVPDQDGKTVRLKDFLGKKAVLLAFYPKAFTPG